MSDLILSSGVQLDPDTVAFYLEVPRNQVVLLQTFFELYDGVGTVRTVDGERALVCVLTTPSMAEDCRKVLMGIREQVSWVLCDPPPSP